MTVPLCDGDDTPATLPPSRSRGSFFEGLDDFSNSTNLDRFLKGTSPVVQAMQFRQTINGRGTEEGKFQQHFNLGNLWKSYAEPSAFGLGVPVWLDETDFVMQYYAPYLSGIQLYLDPSVPPPRCSEEMDADWSTGSSDGSSEHETDMEPKFSSRQGFGGNSVSNKTVNGSNSNEGARGSAAGVLVFEFFEDDSPCNRIPLINQIVVLTDQFPELLTYSSHDLSPASWFSVAWFPICTIPKIQVPKQLDSCFLTFHSLSTLPRGGQNEWIIPFNSQPKDVPCEQIPGELDMDMKMSLPTFGLATYKLIASFWENAAVGGDPKASTLLRVAKDWLEKLSVCLPDYVFYASRP